MRRIAFVSVVAMGLLATTYAQESARPGGSTTTPSPAGGQGSTSAQGSSSRANDTAKPIVVTGCITGTAGSFRLTNAMAASSTAKPGDNAIGTSGVASSYDLTARAGVDLSSHVGHKVEITGTPDASAAGSGSPGATGVDRSTAGSSGAATDRASDRPSAGAGGAASDRAN